MIDEQKYITNLLQINEVYVAGDILKDFIVTSSNREEKYFHTMIHEGATTFVFSTKCHSCVPLLNDVYDYYSLELGKNTFVFIECEDHEYKILDEALGKYCTIIRGKRNYLVKNLRTPGVPWIYHINQDKRIMFSGKFESMANTISIFEDLRIIL